MIIVGSFQEKRRLKMNTPQKSYQVMALVRKPRKNFKRSSSMKHTFLGSCKMKSFNDRMTFLAFHF